MGVVAGAADQAFLGGELVGALGIEEFDQPLHLGHHFRADAVAGEQQEIVGCHTRYLVRQIVLFQSANGALPGPHDGAGDC